MIVEFKTKKERDEYIVELKTHDPNIRYSVADHKGRFVAILTRRPFEGLERLAGIK